MTAPKTDSPEKPRNRGGRPRVGDGPAGYGSRPTMSPQFKVTPAAGQLDAIDAIAAALGLSRNALMRELMDAGIAKHRKVLEEHRRAVEELRNAQAAEHRKATRRNTATT